MKIAYISTVYFSDVDLSFLSEMKNHAEIDYYLSIGPLTKGAAVNIDTINPKYGIIPATEYQELNVFGKIIDLSKMFIINNPHHSRTEAYKLWWKVYIHLKKQNYDIINITEFPHIHEFPIYLLRKRIVLSVHDPFMHSSVKSKRIVFERNIAMKILKSFIIFNRSQKEDFINTYKLKQAKVFDSRLSSYSYLRMYQPQPYEGEPYALFFGQVTTHKGIEYFYQAMQKVQEKYPHIKMVVAGKNKNVDLSLLPNVKKSDTLYRFVPEKELVELINGAMCVVCPYIDATQSGVVMSAFAFMKPVIVTNVGGLPEMVRNGELGIVVPPRDSQAIADAIIYMKEHPEIIKQFEAAIELWYFKGDYSWKTIADDVYHDCYKIIANK